MELEEIRAKVAGRTPGLMDCRRFFAVLVPIVEKEDGCTSSMRCAPGPCTASRGRCASPGGRWSPGRMRSSAPCGRPGWSWGSPGERIRVLGPLDFIAHRSNFLMQPVLAVVEEAALGEMVLNPPEVEETFLVPLSHLLETEPLEYEYPLVPGPREDFPYELVGIPRSYPWRTGRENVPVYPWKDHAIWGPHREDHPASGEAAEPVR